MNNIRYLRVFIPLIMIIFLIGGCTAATDEVNDDGIVIIEPGDLPITPDANSDEVSIAEIVFKDKGEYTSISDLSAAQAKISSYYYEQNIPYTDASVFVRVWCVDNKMKVISSVEGYVLTEFYYDLDEMTVISYSPADGDTGLKMHYTGDSEEAPDNPLVFDYDSFTHVDNEEVARQLCYVFETDLGDKLWISTKYGFPMQKEFVDHFGERYTVVYNNIQLNSISEDDVAVPEDMPIYDLNANVEE